MKKHLGLFFLGTLFVAACAQAQPAAITREALVSRSVGQIGNQVITSREVIISYLLGMSLDLEGGAAGSAARGGLRLDKRQKEAWAITEKSQAYREHLNQVFLELIVFLEAENFSVAQVDSGEVNKNSQRALQLFKDWDFWKKLEVGQAEIEMLVLRKMRARAFMKFKTESSQGVITDEEAKAYFEKNRVKFGAAPFGQFKENIKEFLSQEQTQNRLRDWFEVLKRKYRVRYIGSD